MSDVVWGLVHRDIIDLLADRPVDVPAVVDHLTRLQDLLDRRSRPDDACPVADFNRLYLTITERVLEGLYEGFFADVVFLSRLDVEFAARYFDALRLWTDSNSRCPKAWSCLFRRMQGPDVRPLPSAAAGINAHINYDLPFALVTTFDSLESEPVDGSDQHDDYLKINNIFAAQIPSLRRGYLDEWQLLVDMLNGEVDDWYQGELVEYARNVAWRNAKKIWRCRNDRVAHEQERLRLDNNAELLGRLLLSPLGAFLQ
ncbi:DUF5995 family protein [Salinispora tropica]|uniref:Uncharacterized protein n=1 Tax=Salinispora tropica (strain ATCC BAA-916 / DSM 44818 / JCM 13857 / NBRC 105044 / CNB-440) TaxID=369723 RepID=A4X7V8_SALTO|nr:DUF5995 family protein [Salinispora tropica]ABP54958.1 hypothetical protein Strop_2512 [Salinispora tropica CNB-440]